MSQHIATIPARPHRQYPSIIASLPTLAQCGHHLGQVPCRQDHQRCCRSGTTNRAHGPQPVGRHTRSPAAQPTPRIRAPKCPLNACPAPSRTARASGYGCLQELYEQSSIGAGAAFRQRWYFWATRSRLPPIIDAARAVNVTRTAFSLVPEQIADDLVEGITSLIRLPRLRLAAIAPFETSPPCLSHRGKLDVSGDAIVHRIKQELVAHVLTSALRAILAPACVVHKPACVGLPQP